VQLYSKKLHDLYSSPHIMKENKPRMERWVGHITYIREVRNARKILVKKKLMERHHFRDLDMDGG